MVRVWLKEGVAGDMTLTRCIMALASSLPFYSLSAMRWATVIYRRAGMTYSTIRDQHECIRRSNRVSHKRTLLPLSYFFRVFLIDQQQQQQNHTKLVQPTDLQTIPYTRNRHEAKSCRIKLPWAGIPAEPPPRWQNNLMWAAQHLWARDDFIH